MNRKLLIPILLAVTAITPALADCNGRPCGVGPLRALTPQGHRGASFRPACQQHDNCYSQGPFSRKQCDDKFLQSMLSACRNSKNPAACVRRARMMHFNVRLFGGLFYRK